eukprot:c21063_g1_i1 orf=183-443(-)
MPGYRCNTSGLGSPALINEIPFATMKYLHQPDSACNGLGNVIADDVELWLVCEGNSLPGNLLLRMDNYDKHFKDLLDYSHILFRPL